MPFRFADVRQLAAVVSHWRPKGSGEPAPISFLIGAGFSASAGIPLARDIVADLKGRPLLSAAGSAPPGVSEYQHLMEALPPAERAARIRDYIRRAECDGTHRLKINWAHLLLAALVEQGYVRRVLTTNFDPLVVESLALLGLPIRAVDLYAADAFDPAALQDGSVVYLHGQGHGCFLANTGAETARATQSLPAVLGDAVSNCVLIVVGYSGECDPVLTALGKQFRQFPRRMYWVPYKDVNDIGKQAKELLEDGGREAFVIRGFDADEFMCEFAVHGLQLDFPDIVVRSTKHTIDQLSRITAFPQLSRDADSSSVLRPADPVQTAIAKLREQQHAERPAEVIGAVQSARPAGSPSAAAPELIGVQGGPSSPIESLDVRISIASLRNDVEALLSIAEQRADLDANAREMLGQSLLSASFRGDIGTRERALAQARKFMQDELEWFAVAEALILVERAKGASGLEADRLFEEAGKKYAEAVRIMPDMHEAFSNWGNALSDQAKQKSGAEADRLFEQASEKLRRAIHLKPANATGLFNLACLYSLRGETQQCLKALRERRDLSPPLTRAKVDGDGDFDRVRNEPEFQAFVASLPA